MVAFPHLPENARPLSRVGNVPIDQVLVGSCTNGRIEDLRSAAAVLRGRKVHDAVRMLVFPATQEIFLQAFRKAGSLKGEASLGTWLYRLAMNLCLDRLRPRGQRRPAQGSTRRRRRDRAA